MSVRLTASWKDRTGVVDEDFDRFATGMLNSIDGILLGRVTYQVFAGYWPSATGPDADRMNELPKTVFSKTLQEIEWKNSSVQSHRDRNAAKKFFRKLLKGLRYVPSVIVTDKLRSYNAARNEIKIRRVGRRDLRRGNRQLTDGEGGFILLESRLLLLLELS